MNRKTHPSEESFEEFCREVVQTVQARDEEIHAAANAPFLYQRLRAQIAAEQKPILSTTLPGIGFLAALGALQHRWRWTMVAATVGLAILAFAGWRGWRVEPNAPSVAQQQIASTPTATPAQITVPLKQEPVVPNESKQAATAVPKENPSAKATPHKVSRESQHFATATVAEESEIATEFMPLTYSGDQDDDRGQIVRMEIPLSALIALGIPMAKELTGERVKADVKVGDDGVALAIRLVSNNNE